MANPQIVQGFPYVAWMLLVSLAFGSLAFVVVTRQVSDATPGYVRFTALSAALIALLALATDWGLPAAANLVIQSSSPALTSARQLGLGLFGVLCVAYVFLLGRTRAALSAGTAALVVAGVTLAAGALGWAPTPADAVPLLLQFAMLALATGGALAAIVLGHWYLITPKLSERPLVLQSRLLIAIIGLQALLFLTWTTLGGGPGQSESAASGGSLLLVVMRLIVTIAFPLVLAYMAWRTAQTRSMESATGLLYINLAAIMAGTIGAAALYVSSGILV